MSGHSEVFDSGQHTKHNFLLQLLWILVGFVWIFMALRDRWHGPLGWDHPSIKLLIGFLIFGGYVFYQRIKGTTRFRRHIIIENQGLRLKLHPLKAETWIPWEQIVAIDCRTPEPRLRVADHPGFIPLGENFTLERKKAIRKRLAEIVPDKCISSRP
jgi:hypothetical protein